MNRYLCIHLHFYQPPRENPWLDEIEYQESAYPFHDWNERISAECYGANGSSRILDSEGWVVDIANNYAKTSFNFGPTLLSWLEEKDPDTYSRILEGDRLSQQNFGGHGSAIAQCYNHIIMPLAARRDKETQILWGLKDFESRFRRSPESMWLPETAVDLESLDIMSANGMKYVILAPRQAKAVRKAGSEEWSDVSGERVNPREPYWVRLPSGRKIATFFYDGPISKAVAFEGLLHNGEGFAHRLLEGFHPDKTSRNQLLHISTDGETYGHHHPLGDMALAYALAHLERNQLATVTNYGQYLELNPPEKEAQIHEFSSWSCAHGVERWRSNCGCNSGQKGSWNQKWRKPFREAVDHLRDRLKEPFEQTLKPYIRDPWSARNDYISVVKDRSLANIDRFLYKWCEGRSLTDSEITLILKAFEAQRHLLLMYTSCAWFFDEISGLETVQNLQYAYRAIELAESAFGIALEGRFLEDLEKAKSNLPETQNGKVVFERYVKPARVDNVRVGIHFAISSVFESFSEMNEVFNYKITLLDFFRLNSGKASFVCGHARIRSRITLERQQIMFGVLHLGDHNISAGVKAFTTKEEYQELVGAAEEAFARADFPGTMRIIDRHFQESTYSLRDLFRDEQKRVVDLIMKEAMQATEERFTRLYEANYPLFCFLSDLHLSIPKAFRDIAEFVENRGLRKNLFKDGRVKVEKIRRILEEAKEWNTNIDGAGFAKDILTVLQSKIRQLEQHEDKVRCFEEILELVRLCRDVPYPVQLGSIQNWLLLWYKSRSRELNGQISHSSQELRVEELAKALAHQLQVRLPDRIPYEEEHVSGNKTEKNTNRISVDLSITASK